VGEVAESILRFIEPGNSKKSTPLLQTTIRPQSDGDIDIIDRASTEFSSGLILRLKPTDPFVMSKSASKTLPHLMRANSIAKFTAIVVEPAPPADGMKQKIWF
jgi:hypothetical protein